MSEQGMNLSAVFRKGTGKRYGKRPPANCVSARRAWDHAVTKYAAHGGPAWMQLLDGFWGGELADGTGNFEMECVHFRREWWK
jgi:hypothetical protein